MAKPGDPKTTFKRALAAFDAITKASYHGFNFKTVLAENPEALEAAEKLASFVHPPAKSE